VNGPAPRVLLLGGLDPSGGAGITSDATVVALHRAQPLPIAVAFTEQNRRGFRRCHAVPAETWCRALHAVLDDGDVQAVKVGLLPDEVSVRAVARELAALRNAPPIVVDPVLAATAGGWAPPAALPATVLELLVPAAALLTPNLPELAALCDGDPARALAAGTRAVLVKGGHGDGTTSDDVLYTDGDRIVFRRERQACGPVRGTGCALAAAIAARLAHGAGIGAAARHAGDWVAALLRALGPAPADGLPRTLPFARVLPLPG
jgi:hydroxymethylpyrimidine/phosphomethylpyrimidine kinase